MDNDLATDVKHGSMEFEVRACRFLGVADEAIGQDKEAIREYGQALKACEIVGTISQAFRKRSSFAGAFPGCTVQQAQER